ncbi:hypothetical protein HBI56_123050 [Parastagonospora nodorum]|nr:hypothetical protein HBH50_008720 [Parastagonospora nodorum]KAH4095856.1 hypothetical protein HBH48_049050 [Parastagonospora nodorum]KAH4197607.1 hypothetical protein HBH42_059510 [Parastagonospora nodorum]KAH4259393.1 hypothetical protein HBI03_133580 [Parastagonospora nodorum]KAH4281615.1 hypothetical protein HBI04_040850 [Parastagonospora nodorum]
MRSLTLLFLALAPCGVLSQRISKDATCGGAKGYSCLGSSFGNCCSQYGWCGSDRNYCDKGCQSKFGKCNQDTVVKSSSAPAKTSSKGSAPSVIPASPSNLAVSTNARCGKSFGGKTCMGSQWGDCCSQYSYCGSSKDHCNAKTCQKGYGNCNAAPSSSTSIQTSTTPLTSSKGSAVASGTSSAAQSSASLSAPDSAGSSVPPLSTGISAASIQSSGLSSGLPSANTPSPADSIISVSTLSSASTPAIVASAGSSPSSESTAIASQSSSLEASSTTNNDSPPFTPTASVILPSDPEQFLATFTFQDDPLPTPVAMGSPPIVTGAEAMSPNLVPTCLIIPGQADATFNLLEPNDRVPIVKRADGTLGPVKAPKSEAEYEAMKPIVVEDVKLTSFAFVSSTNGLFDIFTNDNPRQYVAKKPDGSVTLTDQVTNDDQLVTSIFDVTCEGRVTVRIGTQYYTWALSNGNTVMAKADGTPDTMWTLPTKAAAVQRRKRTKSQDSYVPRCPSYPRPLDARVFDGARGNNPNKCGSKSFKVPDLSFGSCCDQHDNDFDDCSMTFMEGNNRFLSCMSGSGCKHLDHWYSYPLYLGCLNTALFYYSVVSSVAGQMAFYSANTDRCRCFCTGSTPDGCMVKGQFQCLNVKSNDVNNCGACGRTCPQGSRCEGGQCKCPAEQCGDRCVSLSSHPKNCGSCGRVSPSGYCVQGQPYTPPAFCSRGNAFRNGNFANGGNDWSAQIVSGGGNSRFDVGFDGGAEDADRSVGIFSLYAPNGGANLKTSLKMCPKLAYKLGFQIRRPYGTDSCTYYVYVAGELKNSGPVPQPTKVGAGWMWVSGLSAGPFYGERQGVSVAGPELSVDFQLDIRCSGNAPYNFIRVDQFSVNPVQ